MKFAYERQKEQLYDNMEDLQDRIVEFLSRFTRRQQRRGRFAVIRGKGIEAWGRSKEGAGKGMDWTRYRISQMTSDRMKSMSWWPAVLGVIALASTGALLYWAYQAGFFSLRGRSEGHGFEATAGLGDGTQTSVNRIA